MRISLLLFILLYAGSSLLGQTSLLGDADGPRTLAVIVGVSKYKDEKITSLNFADEDAKAFASFLQSTAGGSVPPENIRLLTNEEATSANFFREMVWLGDESQEGDKAIIYFSGHGDVERKLPGGGGFLLTHDCPHTNYLGPWSISLDALQTYISGLEAKNVKVIMISDACRSGNLAGNAIGGSGITTLALKNGFQNTAKILSCQPEELSLEGTQWGGGHAAFTYHLIQGLMGLADDNKDEQVTLWEIDKYLSETVSREVAPKEQTPFTDGDRKVVLATVDKKTLRTLKKAKEEELPSFDIVETKGFEESALKKASREVKDTYANFLRTLEAEQLLEPKEDCADHYYQQLMLQDETEAIRPSITRNYAAALWDASVDAFHVYIKSDSIRLAEMFKSDPKFSLYPGYLKRASELLDSTHYMYKNLVGTYNYFQGKVKTVEYFETGKPQAVLDEAIASQEKSLEYLETANSYFELAIANYNNRKIDEAIKFYEKAIELSPTWSQPYDGLGSIYRDMGKYQQAGEMYDKALEYAPKELLGPAHRNIGYVSYKMGNYMNAETHLNEAKKYRPEDPFIHYYLGAMYRDMMRPDEAEAAFLKTIQLQNSFAAAFYYLGLVYQDQDRFADAQEVLETAVKEDPRNPSFLYHLGANHYYLEDYETARSTLEKVLALDPGFSDAYYYLGNSLQKLGRNEEAKVILEKATEKSPKDPEYFFQLGLLQFEKGNYPGADSLFQKVLALDPGQPYARYYLGMSYYLQKRLDEAIIQLEKAQQLLTDDPNLNYQLGLVYYENTDFINAESALRKAIELNPTNGLAYQTLGFVLMKLGREDEGAQMLGKAQELGVE